MRLLVMTLLSFASIALCGSAALAQPGGDRGPREGRSQGGFNPDTIVDRIMNFDKNNDGKLSKDEMPERMQTRFGDTDTNNDGALDRAELKQFAAKMMSRFGGGDRDGDRPRPDGDRPRPDGPRPPGGPQGQRGPTPERLVEHAMEFDTDKDGKLDKTELLEFAKEMIARRGRGGPGGPPRGQGGFGPPRDGDRDRPDSGGQGVRPKRPPIEDAF